MSVHLLVFELVEVLGEWVRHADIVDQHADVLPGEGGLDALAGRGSELREVDRQDLD